MSFKKIKGKEIVKLPNSISLLYFYSDVRDHYLNVIPMRRMGDPDEMGGPAVFLCSDDASYVTGETLVAGGGINSRL